MAALPPTAAVACPRPDGPDAVAFCLLAPSASTAPTSLGRTLGNLWTTVLETPTPDNPFGGGDGCVALGGNLPQDNIFELKGSLGRHARAAVTAKVVPSAQ